MIYYQLANSDRTVVGETPLSLEYGITCAEHQNTAAATQASEAPLLLPCDAGDTCAVGSCSGEARIRVSSMGPVPVAVDIPVVSKQVARQLFCSEELDEADSGSDHDSAIQQQQENAADCTCTDGKPRKEPLKLSMPLLSVHAMVASGSVPALLNKATQVNKKNEQLLARAQNAADGAHKFAELTAAEDGWSSSRAVAGGNRAAH